MRRHIVFVAAMVAGVCVPSVGVELFRVLALGRCDGKFGCAGGVAFVAEFSLLAALIAAFSGSVVSAIAARRHPLTSTKYAGIAGLAAGATLAAFLRVFPALSLPGDVLGGVVVWMGVAAAASWASLFLVMRAERRNRRTAPKTET